MHSLKLDLLIQTSKSFVKTHTKRKLRQIPSYFYIYVFSIYYEMILQLLDPCVEERKLNSLLSFLTRWTPCKWRCWARCTTMWMMWTSSWGDWWRSPCQGLYWDQHSPALSVTRCTGPWWGTGSSTPPSTRRKCLMKVSAAIFCYPAMAWCSAQLAELRKTSLARVLCDNSGLLATQPLAFRTVSER